MTPQNVRNFIFRSTWSKRRAIHRSAFGSSGDLEFLEQRSLLTAQLGPAIAGQQVAHAKTSSYEEDHKSSYDDAHQKTKTHAAPQFPDFSGQWKILCQLIDKLVQCVAAINQQLNSLAMTASIPDVGNVNAPGKVKGNGDMVAKGKVDTPDGPTRFRSAVALTSADVFDGTFKLKVAGQPKETGTLHGERQP